MNSSDEDSRSIFHILLSYFMIFKEIDGFTIYIPPFSKKNTLFADNIHAVGNLMISFQFFQEKHFIFGLVFTIYGI